MALWCVAPGSHLAEAAAIRAPVLVALGERDVLVDPRGELAAYESSPSVDLFVCPRMAHMHNFAGTRELFWRRIETWADWVRPVRTPRALTRRVRRPELVRGCGHRAIAVALVVEDDPHRRYPVDPATGSASTGTGRPCPGRGT